MVYKSAACTMLKLPLLPKVQWQASNRVPKHLSFNLYYQNKQEMYIGLTIVDEKVMFTCKKNTIKIFYFPAELPRAALAYSPSVSSKEVKT